MRIALIRSGRRISVSPFPDYLRHELTFSVLEQDYTRRGKIRTRNVKRSEFAHSKKDPSVVYVPAGFTYRVCRKIEQEGDDFDYTDVRELGLPKPFIKGLDPLRKWQREALARLFSSNAGIIWTATATGKTYLLQQFCKAFPTVRIIVTGQDSSPLESIYKYLLAEYGTDEVKALGVIGNASNPGRITICHVRSLLSSPIDDAQILIYDEVHGAAAPQRSSFLAQVAFANMYGFSASAEGRLDMKEPVIEGLFGPVIYELPYEAARDADLIAPVRVFMYQVVAPEISYDSHRLRMRYGIVRNDARNKMIARVADHFEGYNQIILAMDNLEHVFRLKQRLPDHIPVYSPKSMTKKRWAQLKKLKLIPEGYRPLQPKEEFWLERKFREGEVTKAICTSVWSQGTDLPNLEVLIRADGFPGKIQSLQIPGRVTRKIEGKEEGIVVDFIDAFGRSFENRSRQRIRNYKNIGYEVRVRTL